MLEADEKKRALRISTEVSGGATDTAWISLATLSSILVLPLEPSAPVLRVLVVVSGAAVDVVVVAAVLVTVVDESVVVAFSEDVG